MARPDIREVILGFAPTVEIVRNPEMLYLAMGILGATVMPHNLYLHSSIVQTRKYDQSDAGKHEAIKFATIDSTIALTLALFINAAILILAAAAFHGTANAGVSQLGQAYELLAPALGVGAASTLFAVALLASGQNSTITGTLAGQIVMEGFLNLRIRPWLRRMITRLIAIVPAMVVAALYGAGGTMKLLILSQVILSLQLPFAVIPLLWFVGRRRMMGAFAPPRWLMVFAWSAAAVIVALNAQMLWGMSGELVSGGSNP
jgi:manganese transport protein